MTDRDWCNSQPDAAELNEAFDLAMVSGSVTKSTIASLIHKLQASRSAASATAGDAIRIVQEYADECIREAKASVHPGAAQFWDERGLAVREVLQRLQAASPPVPESPSPEKKS